MIIWRIPFGRVVYIALQMDPNLVSDGVDSGVYSKNFDLSIVLKLPVIMDVYFRIPKF